MLLVVIFLFFDSPRVNATHSSPDVRRSYHTLDQLKMLIYTARASPQAAACCVCVMPAADGRQKYPGSSPMAGEIGEIKDGDKLFHLVCLVLICRIPCISKLKNSLERVKANQGVVVVVLRETSEEKPGPLQCNMQRWRTVLLLLCVYIFRAIGYSTTANASQRSRAASLSDDRRRAATTLPLSIPGEPKHRRLLKKHTSIDESSRHYIIYITDCMS